MYECPNCGGNLKFDIPSQALLCAYCEASFDPYSIQKEEDAKETEYFETRIFTCPQCGGEIVSEDHEAASFCSFCGASTILSGRIAKEKRPRFIIPFKVTKEDCKRIYARKMKKAFFVPKELKDPAFIDSFRGIYMPYWTYQLTQNKKLSLSAEKSYRKGDYICTDHFKLHGNLEAYYLGYAYDASTSFYDSISEALAPYDAKELVNFTPAFLSGFYADTADVGEEVYRGSAMELANDSSFKRICSEKEFKGYRTDVAENKKNRSELLGTRCKSADNTMYPVWFLSYRRGDRVGYATVNGQTGKMAADMPIDFKRYLLFAFLVAVPVFLALNLFFTIKPGPLLLLSAGLCILTALIRSSERKEIQRKETGADDKGLMSQAKKQKAQEEAEKAENIKAEKTGRHFFSPRDIRENPGFYLTLAAVAAAAVITLLKPVSDLYYYGGAMFAFIVVLVQLSDVIRNYNRLAMRRLPQFDKKGGDHRA